MIEKEEAIKIFKDKLHTMEHGAICCNFGIDKDAFNLAIQALEQEPCEDAISRQAVLDAITANCIWENEYNLTSSRIKSAVEKLPPVNPQKPICPSAGIDCEDCPAYEDAISREAVLKIYDEWFANCNIADKKESPKSKIKALPPVTPQPKMGHWIFVDKAKEHARCSECGYGDVDLFNGKPHNYCEKCGVKMVEPQESEDKE